MSGFAGMIMGDRRACGCDMSQLMTSKLLYGCDDIMSLGYFDSGRETRASTSKT